MNRDHYIEHALEFAKAMMKQTGSLMPMIHAEGPHGITIIGLPFLNPTEKLQMLGMAKSSFRFLRVKRYLLITEMFAAPPFENEEKMQEARRKYGSVENMPGRREGIAVAYSEYDYREMRTLLTIRPEEGKGPAVDFVEHNKICGMENLRGDFFELLPDPHAPVDLLTERAVREFLKHFELRR